MPEAGLGVDLDRIGEMDLGKIAVLVVDGGGRVLGCNAAAAVIFGRTREALLGDSAAAWFPDESGASVVERTFAEGARVEDAESWVTRAGGVRLPVAVSSAPIPRAGGGLQGAVVSFQDLSGIRQLQQQVLQTEKMAAIGQLAAGVAHEINNPMGFIHANLFQMAEYVADLRRVSDEVDGLRKAAAAGDPKEIAEAASRLGAVSDEVDVDFLLSDLAKAIRESQEGSERIRHIVQDLRDFSHPDSSERELADINQCLDSTANIVWPIMKHLVVLKKNYGDLPSVPAYPMQIKQVLMNLLVNACQAIEQRVGRSGEMGTIELETCVANEGVEVRVSDDGVGISAEHRQRIFDPFFTTKRVGSGMGLGLSTSFKIVERHGGTLSVESEENVGTTMRLFLPTGARAPG